MHDDRETTPCTICTKPTPMLGTRLCDPCWELVNALERASRLIASEGPGRIITGMLTEVLAGMNPRRIVDEARGG